MSVHGRSRLYVRTKVMRVLRSRLRPPLGSPSSTMHPAHPFSPSTTVARRVPSANRVMNGNALTWTTMVREGAVNAPMSPAPPALTTMVERDTAAEASVPLWGPCGPMLTVMVGLTRASIPVVRATAPQRSYARAVHGRAGPPERVAVQRKASVRAMTQGPAHQAHHRIVGAMHARPARV
jgi:hypothetical protein